MREGHAEKCYYCEKLCNSLSANPGDWPIGLCHRNEPGVVKWHHTRCVSDKLRKLEDIGDRWKRVVFWFFAILFISLWYLLLFLGV